MNLFKSTISSLKLKTQLLIVISLLIIFMVTLQLGSNYLNKTLVEYYLLESSQQINTINSNVMVAQMVFWYQRYFHNLFDIHGNALLQFHQLYDKIKRETHNSILNEQFNMNYGGVNEIPQSIQAPHGMRNYNITFSFLCYAQKQSQTDLINIKMQEQLQTYGQILFGDIKDFQTLFSSYVERDDMLMTYPCLQRFDIENYVPQARFWYIEATKVFNTHQPYYKYNLSVTQPYLFFNSTTLALSTVLPIVDEEHKQIGSAAFEITAEKLISEVFQQFGQDFTLIYLVSPDGILIMHPYNITANQLPLYIYNESITGFSLQNWKLLMSAQSNCSKLVTFKCLYNSYFQKDMIASLKKLDEYNIYILVTVSSAEFTKFQSQLDIVIESELIYQFQLNVLQNALIFICSGTFVILITKILFYPLELIIKITIEQFYQKNSENHLSNNTLLSDEMKQLYDSCLKFNNRLSTCKAKECRIIEERQYPLRQKIFLTRFMKNNNGNIPSKKGITANIQRKILQFILATFQK